MIKCGTCKSSRPNAEYISTLDDTKLVVTCSKCRDVALDGARRRAKDYPLRCPGCAGHYDDDSYFINDAGKRTVKCHGCRAKQKYRGTTTHKKFIDAEVARSAPGRVAWDKLKTAKRAARKLSRSARTTAAANVSLTESPEGRKQRLKESRKETFEGKESGKLSSFVPDRHRETTGPDDPRRQSILAPFR